MKKLFVLSLCLMSGIACAMGNLDDASIEEAFEDGLALGSGATAAAPFATVSSQPPPPISALTIEMGAMQVGRQDFEEVESDQRVQSQEGSPIDKLAISMGLMQVGLQENVRGVTKKRRTQKIRSNRIGPVTPPRKNVPPICPTAPGRRLTKRASRFFMVLS